MVLHDLLRNRETQPCPILFAMTDEGLEQFVADGRFYPRTVVAYKYIEVAVLVSHGDSNVTTAHLRRLAAVEQQVVKHALHFSGIELRAVQAG